jgi:hypothetical protein
MRILAAPSLVTVSPLPLPRHALKKRFGLFIAVLKVGKVACQFHLQETF